MSATSCGKQNGIRKYGKCSDTHKSTLIGLHWCKASNWLHDPIRWESIIVAFRMIYTVFSLLDFFLPKNISVIYFFWKAFSLHLPVFHMTLHQEPVLQDFPKELRDSVPTVRYLFYRFKLFLHVRRQIGLCTNQSYCACVCFIPIFLSDKKGPNMVDTLLYCFWVLFRFIIQNWILMLCVLILVSLLICLFIHIIYVIV